MSKLASRLQTWAWVMLYGGLLLGSWSLFLVGATGQTVWIMRAAALAGVLLGMGLIFWRSRVKP